MTDERTDPRPRAVPEGLGDITNELAKVDRGKIKAIQDNDRVYLVIQDAPAELRKLAAALERINVREIKALVAYMNPETGELQTSPAPAADEPPGDEEPDAGSR